MGFKQLVFNMNNSNKMTRWAFSINITGNKLRQTKFLNIVALKGNIFFITDFDLILA